MEEKDFDNIFCFVRSKPKKKIFFEIFFKKIFLKFKIRIFFYSLFKSRHILLQKKNTPPPLPSHIL